MAIAIGGNQVNKSYLGTTEIQKMYLGSELVFDNSVQPVLLTPVMSNFRVDDANKDRVYFDVVGDITGLTTTGFVISGNTVSSVDTVNNYFTVGTPFTFWDNNTIRLESGDGTVYDFTLEHITNSIDEPEATNYRYVTTTGGTGTGLVGDPWSLTYAAEQATSGMTVWVKAGDYTGLSTIDWDGIGTPSSPIKFIGYKTTEGDITENYIKDYADFSNWSTSEMPTVTGSGFADTNASYLDGQYYIIRNIQFQNHATSMRYISGSLVANNVIDNINSRNNYSSSTNSGLGLNFYYGGGLFKRIRVTNSAFLNHALTAINLETGTGSGNHLIKDCVAYSDRTDSNETADYFFTLSGDNSIAINNTVEQFNTGSSGGSCHGIGVRGHSNTISEYNLISNNNVKSVQEGVYVRNNNSNYNVIKDNYIGIGTSAPLQPNDTGGMVMAWGGCDYNVFERNHFDKLAVGMWIRSDVEDSTPAFGRGNIVRNNIFEGTPTQEENLFIYLYSNNGVPAGDNSGNKIYNNVIKGYDDFYDVKHSGGQDVNLYLEFDSNIIENVSSLLGSAGYGTPGNLSFDYNNTNNIWTTTLGTNYLDQDPLLDANFLPANENLYIAPRLTPYDYNSKERTSPITTIGPVTLTSEDAGDQPPTTANYYISENGDNTDGLTQETAWTSIDSFNSNSASIPDGSTIQFEREQTYRGNLIVKGGSVGKVNTYTAYGTGYIPQLLGCINKTNQSNWTDEGSNIWRLAEVLTDVDDIGNMIMDFENIIGIKVMNEVDLSAQTEFYFDKDTHILKVYCTQNPGLEYTNIELAKRGDIILASSIEYTDITNLDIRYGGSHGVRIDGSHYLNVSDCAFRFIGGARLFYTSDIDDVRYGNGIEMWNDCSNIIVEDNNIYQIYDSGVTPQGSGAYAQNNIIFRNNTIDRCEYSMEFFGDDLATINDISFNGNICSNAGGSWGHNQRTDGVRGTHIMIFNLPISTPNCEFINNQLTESTEQATYILNSDNVSTVDINYNTYIETTGNIARVGSTSYDISEWELYKSDTGQDTNSTLNGS